MGNRASEEKWAGRERLAGVERWLYWRGYVRRRDVSEVYGVSAAQASADLQRYQELNPGAMSYNMSRKCYEGTERMQCVLGEPNFAGAVAQFFGGGGLFGREMGGEEGGDGLAVVRLPMRKILPKAQRAVLMALLDGRGMQIRYLAVNASGDDSSQKRWIRPTQLVWDGGRWHVRAWCELREGYRDFVLSRMDWVGWPEEREGELPVDEEWEEQVSVTLTPNEELSESARWALETDYDLKPSEPLVIETRKALQQYVLERFGVRRGEGLPRQWRVIGDGLGGS